MNNKNLIGIAFLVVAIAFAIQTLQHNPVEARPTIAQETSGFEFARLEVQDNDSVTWFVGGTVNNRTESVIATYRRLGGSGRGTFADLLDQIGSGGWNLVQVTGNTWIFSRQAS